MGPKTAFTTAPQRPCAHVESPLETPFAPAV